MHYLPGTWKEPRSEEGEPDPMFGELVSFFIESVVDFVFWILDLLFLW